MIIETDDISLHRGDDKTIPVSVVNANDQVVNITGSEIKFSVKRRLSDSAAVIEKVSTDVAEILIISPTAGNFEIFLVPADTQSLLDKIKYEYDIQLTTSAGKVYTIGSGKFFIKWDVSV